MRFVKIDNFFWVLRGADVGVAGLRQQLAKQGNVRQQIVNNQNAGR